MLEEYSRSAKAEQEIIEQHLQNVTNQATPMEDTSQVPKEPVIMKEEAEKATEKATEKAKEEEKEIRGAGDHPD